MRLRVASSLLAMSLVLLPITSFARGGGGGGFGGGRSFGGGFGGGGGFARSAPAIRMSPPSMPSPSPAPAARIGGFGGSTRPAPIVSTPTPAPTPRVGGFGNSVTPPVSAPAMRSSISTPMPSAKPNISASVATPAPMVAKTSISTPMPGLKPGFGKSQQRVGSVAVAPVTRPGFGPSQRNTNLIPGRSLGPGGYGTVIRTAPSYSGAYQNRPIAYGGNTYNSHYYGGFNDYSYGWQQPMWYYHTPFSPMFYTRPPVVYNGEMYPGGTNWVSVFISILCLLVLLYVISKFWRRLCR